MLHYRTPADNPDGCTIYFIHKTASVGQHNVWGLLTRCVIQAVDPKINSPLQKTAEGGFVASVKILIDNGAYLNARFRPFTVVAQHRLGHTLLHLLGRGTALDADWDGS